MFKNVLVPIDLSGAQKSKPTLDLLRTLCAPDARVTLLHVVEDIPRYVAVELPQEVLKARNKYVQQELTAAANAAGVKASVEVRSGPAANGILAAAEEHGADLIIVSSHKPGLQDYLLGSTAARVVRHAACPVLVMR
ncbi:MAG TPA: universal stress protein [Hyphomicrobiaceae bacterium]|nr:universal stress protein [Hyphomicrobiaceae bacterium]